MTKIVVKKSDKINPYNLQVIMYNLSKESNYELLQYNLDQFNTLYKNLHDSIFESYDENSSNKKIYDDLLKLESRLSLEKYILHLISIVEFVD